MPAKTLSPLGILFNERRKFYLDKDVAELWTSATPFLSFSAAMRSKGSKDPLYKMFEHRSGWTNMRFHLNDGTPNDWDTNAGAGLPNEFVVFDAVDGIVGALPNSSNVPDNSWIGQAGRIYQDDGQDDGITGDLICYAVITAVNSSSGDVTVKNIGNPASSSYAAAKPLDNAIFIVTHSISGEGTVAPSAKSDELEIVHNSATIIETPVEVTGTLREAALRGYSNELARLRSEATKEHAMKMNGMYYHAMSPIGIGGVAHGAGGGTDSSFVDSTITDANSKVLRTGMGIIPALIRYGISDTTNTAQNVFHINSATYKYDNFARDAAKIFQYVPVTGFLMGFCDMRMLTFWSLVSQGGFLGNSKFKVQLSLPMTDTVGLSVRELLTPAGTVRLTFDPALTNEPKGTMVIVDPAHIGQVKYRKTRMKLDVKTDDDYDGQKDNIRSDEGPWLDLIEVHSYWTLD